ncbi:MAG: sensor histidine kinase [Ginsengibacter sp.]
MKQCIIYLFYYVMPVFLLLSGQAHAQKVINSDSALHAIGSMKDDTSKVKSYYKYGDLWVDLNTDSARLYYRKARELAHTIGSNYLEAVYYSYEIPLLNDEGKYSEALQLCLDAEDRFKKNKPDKNELVLLNNNLANEWQYLGDFNTAARHYFIALSFAKEIGNMKFQALCINNLASLYEELGDKVKLLEYAKEAKDIALKIRDTIRLYTTSYNLAEAYLANNMTGEALTELKYIEPIVKYLQQPEYNMDVLVLKADLCMKLNDNRKASEYLLKILELCKQNENVEYELAASKGLAEIFSQNGDLSLAKQYSIEALAAAKKTGALKQERDCLKIAADIETKSGNFAHALQIRNEYDIIVDSLSGSESKKNIQLLDIQYQTEKKQALIKQLEKEKELQALSLKQKNTFNALLGIGMFAAVIIGFLFYRNTKRKQQLGKQAAEIKDIRINELEKEKQLFAVNSILEAQEMERTRMAKDLHDGLGGMLSGIKLNLSSIKEKTVIPAEDAQLFGKSIRQLDNAIAEMRRVAHNMMPEALLKFGLSEAIKDYCDGINESNTVKMRYYQLNLPHTLEKSTEVIIYRLVQELSNNAIKHAHAKNILVQIIRNDYGITLTVEDDGKGFDTAHLAKGAGLQNVQSRVDYLRGNLEIQSKPGEGSSFNIEIPL